MIGAELSASDLEVDVLPCFADPKPDGYDAVIVGSAIYISQPTDVSSRSMSSTSSTTKGGASWCTDGPKGSYPLTRRCDSGP